MQMAKTVSGELSSGLGFGNDVLCGPGQVIALPFPYLLNGMKKLAVLSPNPCGFGFGYEGNGSGVVAAGTGLSIFPSNELT